MALSSSTTTAFALFPIHFIPGLYISNRLSARSKPLLAEHKITHVLSILRWEDGTVTFYEDEGTEEESIKDRVNGRKIIRKHIELDDDPLAELLGRLSEIVNFIHDALFLYASESKISRFHARSLLGTSTEPPMGNTDDPASYMGGRVLVHCDQGISRSGAVMIAYIMRHFNQIYLTSLALAQGACPRIAPNMGFEYQLRLWQKLEYGVLRLGIQPGQSPADQGGSGEFGTVLMEKPEYLVWKMNIEFVQSHSNEREYQQAKERTLRNMKDCLDNFQSAAYI